MYREMGMTYWRAEAETELVPASGCDAFGPRVEEPAIGLITNMATSAPYEELRLKSK